MSAYGEAIPAKGIRGTSGADRPKRSRPRRHAHVVGSGRSEGRPDRRQNDVSRTLALATGSMVAVTTDWWSEPLNVTVRVSSSVCEVVALKPRLGTAEIRHTPRLPYRTVTLPPCEGTVCRPGPPVPQSTPGLGAAVRAVAEGFADGEDGAEGVGASVTVGEGLGDAEAVGDGGPGEVFCTAGHAGGESKTMGADRATGGVWRVEPTTNWTVASTAVTLVAVHDSHMNR